jgi:aryl-alcohol dehydrogenase-like predicted oxidoreductase
MKAAGIVSNLGVSVYTSDDLKLAMSCDTFDVFQGPLNLLNASLQRTGLIEKARACRKTFIARSIYLQGLLFLKPDQLAGRVPQAKPFLEKLIGIAEHCGRPLDELAYIYVRDQLAVENIVVGVKSLEQLRRNLELSRKPALSSEVREQIDAVALAVPDNVIDPRKWRVAALGD